MVLEVWWWWSSFNTFCCTSSGNRPCKLRWASALCPCSDDRSSLNPNTVPWICHLGSNTPFPPRHIPEQERERGKRCRIQPFSSPLLSFVFVLIHLYINMLYMCSEETNLLGDQWVRSIYIYSWTREKRK